MESYPFAESHGLIGDLQTAALIADDGTLDWFCAPRFDSPSLFAGLLDRKRGGHFRIAPDGVPGEIDRWSAERGRIYHQIMNRGYHPARRAFVQHHDSDVLDAALLIMPAVGFIAPDDPMWQSTLRAMDDELVSDSLVYRYNPTASPDGLPGNEGTFSMCTFWYVEALARSGRLNDALINFEKMLTYSTHLGLFAEEIGPTGEQVGNFPQAFSHLALIRAAMALDYLMDGAPAPCRAPLETLVEQDSPRP
nr:glycoside hydrolase family 15 protein [Micromonospora veneta]